LTILAVMAVGGVPLRTMLTLLGVEVYPTIAKR